MSSGASGKYRRVLLSCALLLLQFAAWPLQARAQQQAVIGTESVDYANGVAVNAAGEIYVTGFVGSGELPFPVTAGSYQAPTAYGGAYLMKLTPNGSLIFSSFIGSSNVNPQAVTLDGDGNVIVAGIASGSFPVTPGAVNSGTGNGTRAFVMKFTGDGSTLLYSALLGPAQITGREIASGGYMNDITGPSVRLAVDAAGSVYVSGTAAAGFQTTPGAFDGALAGSSDVFVAKLSADGSTLLYSTLVGGTARDEGHGIAVDAWGRAIISGFTESSDFPTSTVLNAGVDRHAFVAAIAPNGDALEFSSRISGENGAAARDVALGPTGDIYVTGVTRSRDFPMVGTTVGRFDYEWRTPRLESFVTRLTADGASVVYSTSLLQASRLDDEDWSEAGSAMAISIAVDRNGRAHVVGASGADYNVYAQVPHAFTADVEPDGSSYGAGALWTNGEAGSAAFDIALNDFGDSVVAMNTNSWYDVSAVEPTYGKDPFFPYWEYEGEDFIRGGMMTDGVIFWSIAPRPTSNTPVGGPVTIAASGAAAVTFGTVATAGTTTIQAIDAASLNLTLPGGFSISGVSQAFEIHTTAAVSGIQVCLNGTGLSDAEFASAVILHGVNGAWQAESTSRDNQTRMLCATVASLSPFAIGVRSDVAPPTVTCAAPPAGWSVDNVTITCTAADTGTGLASESDASFTLTTSVAEGAETAEAVTTSREVCDKASNCVTVGPIGGIRIDRKAPIVSISSPTNRRYLLNEVAAAAYTCTDGGQLASCTGTVPNGAPIDTASAGTKSFGLEARDAANHTTTAAVAYTVGYRIGVPLNQTLEVKRGKTLPLAIQLLDAAGANVSAAATTVTVTGLRAVSSGAAVPVQDSDWLNPDHTFRYASGLYVYALGTKGLVPGTYELAFTAGNDPLTQTLTFRVTK
jgi:hypothetical protein